MDDITASDSKNSFTVEYVLDIAEECNKKVEIVYNDEGFFTPHLRSINHLSIGRSAIISSAPTLILELIYQGWIWVRGCLKLIENFISPKRLNSPSDSAPSDSTIIGSLVHAGHADENRPIRNMRVIFWTRSWLLQWRKLAEARTDENGNFELNYNLRSAKHWIVFTRKFEVHQTSYRYNPNGEKTYHYDLFHSLTVPGGDLVGMRYNLRSIQLFFWEYRTDTNIPRTAIKDHDKDAPQYYSQGRLDAIREQIIPIELTKLKHLVAIAENPDNLTVKKIQADYPDNLTVAMERKAPGITRSDVWFGLRMMNGMSAATFEKDDQGFYWTHWYGACDYEISDQREYASPSARIRFQLHDNGVMMPDEIHLMGPLKASETSPFQTRVFTPDDGEQWLEAKRVARVTAALSNEVDDHFTGTHLTTEQFAIAAYRNLQLSPIAALLFPHLKEVALINHSADSILLGPKIPPKPRSMMRDGGFLIWLQDKIDRALNKLAFESGGYIPQATAYTHQALESRTQDLLGVQDWKTWKPMESLSERHIFPRAQQCYWNILGDYLDQYFSENIEAIKEHWHEIHSFSTDLVKHSVPVYLSNKDLNLLTPEAKELAEERLSWYEKRYHFDRQQARDTIDGELKTVSPITHSREFSEEGFENLKDACRYIIMISTFLHSFVNEHQYDDIGEVEYSSLGLRYGTSDTGVLSPESDDSISPDLTKSTQMMWFSNLLSRTEYGMIVRNEEGDLNPLLIDLLKEQSEQMKNFGMPIENIESRTNI